MYGIQCLTILNATINQMHLNEVKYECSYIANISKIAGRKPAIPLKEQNNSRFLA